MTQHYAASLSMSSVLVRPRNGAVFNALGMPKRRWLFNVQVHFLNCVGRRTSSTKRCQMAHGSQQGWPLHLSLGRYGQFLWQTISP